MEKGDNKLLEVLKKGMEGKSCLEVVTVRCYGAGVQDVACQQSFPELVLLADDFFPLNFWVCRQCARMYVCVCARALANLRGMAVCVRMAARGKFGCRLGD